MRRKLASAPVALALALTACASGGDADQGESAAPSSDAEGSQPTSVGEVSTELTDTEGSVVGGAPTEMHSPRIGLVFWLWQCDKENHGWREGPPLTVVLAREFRSVEGLHPPEIFNSNEKRILPSVVIRKPMHFGDWPVYCRLPTVIGNCATSGLPTIRSAFNRASAHRA